MMAWNLPPGCTDADIDRAAQGNDEQIDPPTPEEERAEAWEYWHNRATEFRAENDRLIAALDIARTALLMIERKCEEARAELSRIARR
jgi:hypothetical protein